MINPEENKIEKLVLVKRAAGILAIATTILLVFILFIIEPPTFIPVYIFITLIATFAFVYLFTDKFISVITSAWVIVIAIWLGISGNAYIGGSLDGPIFVVLPTVPLIASILISHRAAVIMGIVSILTIVLLSFTEYLSISDEPILTRHEAARMRGAWMFFTILIITTFGWLYGRANEKLMQVLKSQASTDFLTQVANRRYLDEILEREFMRNKRTGKWLSLLLIDADYFKKLNDTRGHQEGDRCLVRIAEVIKQHCKRASDLVGRYGGEEFVVILPDTSPDAALGLAESVRDAVLGMKIKLTNQQDSRYVTVTIGCCSVQGNVYEETVSLVKAADTLLYEGKAAGRNIVMHKAYAD